MTTEDKICTLTVMRRGVIRLDDLAPKSAQLAFRVEAELLKRLDDYVQAVRIERPGEDFNRTDAVRKLLTIALDQIEAEIAKPTSPARSKKRS